MHCVRRGKVLRLEWETDPSGNYSLHPVAVGAVEEVTNSLKHSDVKGPHGGSASWQAVASSERRPELHSGRRLEKSNVEVDPVQ